MIYELLCANNITLTNAEVKSTFTDKKDAIQALHTEIMLGKAEHGISVRTPCRLLQFTDKIAIDFGSWSDFVGLTNVTAADFDNYGAE